MSSSQNVAGLRPELDHAVQHRLLGCGRAADRARGDDQHGSANDADSLLERRNEPPGVDVRHPALAWLTHAIEHHEVGFVVPHHSLDGLEKLPQPVLWNGSEAVHVEDLVADRARGEEGEPTHLREQPGVRVGEERCVDDATALSACAKASWFGKIVFPAPGLPATR